MKKVYIFFILTLLAWLPSEAQNASQNEVFARIEASIRTGDVETISRYFNGAVQITTDEVDQDFSAVQAKHVLKEFFDKNRVRSFALVHKGQSGDSFYAMGEYQSMNGKFDTNIILIRNGSNFQVDIIRFEKGK
jgi:hypothetical protein